MAECLEINIEQINLSLEDMRKLISENKECIHLIYSLYGGQHPNDLADEYLSAIFIGEVVYGVSQTISQTMLHKGGLAPTDFIYFTFKQVVDVEQLAHKLIYLGRLFEGNDSDDMLELLEEKLDLQEGLEEKDIKFPELKELFFEFWRDEDDWHEYDE